MESTHTAIAPQPDSSRLVGVVEKTMELLGTREEFRRGVFRLNSVTFTHTRSDGRRSVALEHLVFERGDSVAVLLHDLPYDVVVLVEQVRVATQATTGGWLLEIPAGKVDDGEQPAAAARREVAEETTATVVDIQPIATFFPSPGASSEKIHLFYCPSSISLETAETGGLAAEDEDIAIHRIPTAKVFEMNRRGEFLDAKTIIALQWLENQR